MTLPRMNKYYLARLRRRAERYGYEQCSRGNVSNPTDPKATRQALYCSAAAQIRVRPYLRKPSKPTPNLELLNES